MRQRKKIQKGKRMRQKEKGGDMETYTSQLKVTYLDAVPC